MAATHVNKSIPAKTWVQLNATAVSVVTFQNKSNDNVRVAATVTAAAPADLSGSYLFGPKEGPVNVPLAEMFLGVTGASYLWAYSETGADIVVSHA